MDCDMYGDTSGDLAAKRPRRYPAPTPTGTEPLGPSPALVRPPFTSWRLAALATDMELGPGRGEQATRAGEQGEEAAVEEGAQAVYVAREQGARAAVAADSAATAAEFATSTPSPPSPRYASLQSTLLYKYDEHDAEVSGGNTATAAAAALQRNELAAREQTLGPYHPDTLRTASDFARVLQSLGCRGAAQKLFRQVLEGRRRVLGPHHPDALASSHDLGVVLQSQGVYEEATAMLMRSAEGRARVLGPEHPDTLASVAALAGVLCARGRTEEAHAFIQTALDSMRPRYASGGAEQYCNCSCTGASCMDTGMGVAAGDSCFCDGGCAGGSAAAAAAAASAAGSLAAALRNHGLYDMAQSMYEQMAADLGATLGLYHPDSLRAAAELAGVLLGRGVELQRAQQLCRQALKGRRRVLGPHHPDTLASSHDLGAVLQSQGLYDEARQVFGRAAEGRGRVLGPAHPDTLASAACLTEVVRHQEQLRQQARQHHELQLPQLPGLGASQPAPEKTDVQFGLQCMSSQETAAAPVAEVEAVRVVHDDGQAGQASPRAAAAAASVARKRHGSAEGWLCWGAKRPKPGELLPPALAPPQLQYWQ